METGKILKTFPSKKGNIVTIRYVKWEDLDDLLNFANALVRENTFVMLNGKELTREEEIKYLADSFASLEKAEKIHLVAIVNNRVIGSGEIRRLDKRKSHVGFVGISLAQEYRDQGIGTELLGALVAEARKLKLRLLTLFCFENNLRAIHLYEKIGFKHAGIVPGVYRYKGNYLGELTMYLPLVKNRVYDKSLSHPIYR